MPTNSKETLIDWLRDAHAMETSVAKMLEKQADNIDNAEMKSKIREHLETTRDQADRVKGLIENLGGDISRFKELTGTLMANVNALTMGRTPDNAVKAAISNFAVEHFEIASYRSLVAAAEALGETDVKRVCQEILDEEVQMADWLEGRIATVTTQHLRQEQTAQRR